MKARKPQKPAEETRALSSRAKTGVHKSERGEAKEMAEGRKCMSVPGIQKSTVTIIRASRSPCDTERVLTLFAGSFHAMRTFDGDLSRMCENQGQS